MATVMDTVQIGFLLVSLFNPGLGQLTITSTPFECGQSASIECSRVDEAVKLISWYTNVTLIRICTIDACSNPTLGNYKFTAGGGVWTITIDPVEWKDNTITFTCETPRPGNEAPGRVSRTIDVSVPMDISSTLTKIENATDVILKAQTNCVKPVENVSITWQCVKAEQVDVLDSDCRLTALQTYTPECKDLNQTCAGPGTYIMGSDVKLPAYSGNYFKSVKIKAVFTDGTKVIEMISGAVKQEVPPKIAPFRDCSVIENTDFSTYCNLSNGDPSTVKCRWTAPSGTISNNCTLRIHSVQRTSSGKYTCRVENSVGTDTKSFYLDILYSPEKPVLKIVDTDVTHLTANVYKDTPVTIRCLSSAKPNISSYTWEPAEGSLDSQLQKIDTSSPFTRTYACTVTNNMTPSCGGDGEQGSNSSSVNVHIVYPPEGQTIRFNGSHEIDTSGSFSVVRGQSFTLTCSAKSDPASSYKWDTLTNDGDLLSINNISLDQSLTCIASNEMKLFNESTVVGQSNQTVNIEVLYAPSVQTMTGQRVIEGSNFSQICDTTPGRPITTNYLWTRRNGRLSENKLNLTITNVTPGHADNYTCTAWNIVNPSYGNMSNGTDQKTFSLEILFPPKLKVIPNQSVIEGSSFKQNCEFSRHGNPPGKIMWFSLDQAGNEIPIGSVNGFLTIPKVSRNHTGSFKCVTENIMDPTDKEMVKGTDFRIFYLNVFYTTSISSLTIYGTAEEMVVSQNTADVRFMCNVSSNPLSAISLDSKTHSGSMTLQEEQYSDHLLYLLSTATCWDSGEYTCFGRNNVTIKQVSKAVKLLVECTARPLHETEQNITIYQRVGDDITLNLTLVSYPLPASELFQWTRVHKEQTITHFNGSIVNLSDSSLESSLILKDIQESDFGQYKLTIKTNNTMEAFVQYFFINAQDKPQVPKHFVHLEEEITPTTAVLKWTPGFNGGVLQEFNILYKKASDSTWSHIVVSNSMLTLTGLDPSTLYNVYVFASNELGNSSRTVTLNVTTKPVKDESQSSNNGAIIGGTAGGGAAIVVIAVVVVFVLVIFRRKAAAKSRNSSDQIGENLNPESVDDGHDGMDFNPAYVSTDTLTAAVASGSDNVYAQVDKTKKKAAANTDNTYAVVDKTSKKRDKATGQGDVYATPLKKKPGKKTKKDKAVKQKGRGDVYENVQEMNVYGNIGQKDDTTGENVYENREEPPVYKRNLNKDGLIYADLAFENNNRGHKKLVIHGSENQTDYVQVDFSKKAEPLPDSDEEGDIA